MTAIPDLPDPHGRRRPVRRVPTGRRHAETVGSVLVGSADNASFATLLVVDFMWPHLLAALSAGAPSTRGESTLTKPAEDPEPSRPSSGDTTSMQYPMTDAVTFAVVGIATPDITQLLDIGDMILITAEEPGAAPTRSMTSWS